MPTKRKAAGKTEAVSVPAIVLKAGSYVAMDGDGLFIHHYRKPKPNRCALMWYSAQSTTTLFRDEFSGLPRIPKSQWDKHLYRVGKNGELVRVDIS